MGIMNSTTVRQEMPNTFSLKPKERRILEDIVANANLAIDERVLAWVKLKSWGRGQEFACCRVCDLNRDRAEVTVFRCWKKEQIPAALNELVVAGQRQCADELHVPLSHVKASVKRLENRGLVDTPWVMSRAFVTKYKLGVGFRASLATKHVRAFRLTASGWTSATLITEGL